MDYTYVYAAQCEGFVKVGLARSPALRLGYLQVGSPFEITLIDYKEYGSRHAAQDSETLIHTALQGQHVRGEWFLRQPIDPVSLLAEYHRAYLKLVDLFGERYWENEAMHAEAARLLPA